MTAISDDGEKDVITREFLKRRSGDVTSGIWRYLLPNLELVEQLHRFSVEKQLPDSPFASTATW
ncbi:hypothetical protein J5277_13830 [Rhizobium sp. 16-449-1b]|uniref:hypothetical protein n=1 Tax=Rhizobium sp. 16-449-1b TaxID=2819989 RepID=UPI001AD976EB|nr:hypothetical protein [Rhizobium sp. 16-449-1b]MBO9195183.1 hypothetical protein [Rhizobium sp. 16-449-1b]